LEKKDTRERECTSLIAAARKLHCTDLSIVNMNLSADWEVDGLRIKVIPVIDFLLIGPLTRSVTGILKVPDNWDYKKEMEDILEEKYGLKP
jgi:hypothetical protein